MLLGVVGILAIHSLLRRTDVRWSADTIYFTHIAVSRLTHTIIDVIN